MWTLVVLVAKSINNKLKIKTDSSSPNEPKFYNISFIISESLIFIVIVTKSFVKTLMAPNSRTNAKFSVKIKEIFKIKSKSENDLKSTDLL